MLADGLVQAPRDDARNTRSGHEAAMDQRPFPRVRDRIGVVVDGMSIKRPCQAVMHHDVRRRNKKGQPILIQRSTAIITKK